MESVLFSTQESAKSLNPLRYNKITVELYIYALCVLRNLYV